MIIIGRKLFVGLYLRTFFTANILKISSNNTTNKPKKEGDFVQSKKCNENLAKMYSAKYDVSQSLYSFYEYNTTI